MRPDVAHQPKGQERYLAAWTLHHLIFYHAAREAEEQLLVLTAKETTNDHGW